MARKKVLFEAGGLIDTGPSGKMCLMYCGDDVCDCACAPRYRGHGADWKSLPDKTVADPDVKDGVLGLGHDGEMPTKEMIDGLMLGRPNPFRHILARIGYDPGAPGAIPRVQREEAVGNPPSPPSPRKRR